jgi:diguanylate cyclase (GGDEF)-like protein
MSNIAVEGSTRNAALIAAGVGLLLVAVVAASWQTYRANELAEQDADTRLALVSLQSGLDEFVQGHLGAARVLRHARQRDTTNDEAKFGADALGIIAEFPAFQALNWVDETGVIRWVFPEAPNRAARGYNLLSHAITADSVARALANGDLATSPPIDLQQGGRGFVAYLPLRMDGRDTGQVNAVFRLERVFAHAFDAALAARYELRVTDAGKDVFTSSGAFAPDARIQRASVAVGDRTWQIELAARTPLTEASGLARALLGLGLLVSAAIAVLVFVLLKIRSARRAAEREAWQNLNHDALTGLGNRQRFLRHLQRELDRATHAAPCAVILLNAGRFRLVNSVHGPAVGDALLKAMAERLVAQYDRRQVFRLAGDVFAILLPGTDAATAAGRARHLNRVLSEPYVLGESTLAVLCALGVSVAPQHGVTVDEILNAAATALDSARSLSARGAIAFDETMRRAADARVQMEQELRRGLTTGEFRLEYQPLLRLSDRAVLGFEALVRWEHPTRGRLQPEDFIAVAERSGIIEPLGRWVLAEACRQARLWMLDSGVDCRLCVNLSPQQLLDHSLPSTVREILARTGLPAHLLTLEITESLLIENLDAVADILRNIKAVGVSIALDDFGTGYSSLSHLIELPIGAVKVDRSFVRGLGTDERATRLTASIVRMAKAMDLEVVAEGVETALQLEVLQTLGCDQAQGFLFDRPLAPEVAQTRLAKR